MSTSNSLRRFGFFPCRFLLATFLLGAFASAFGQSAPNISYTTPRILGRNGASYTLTPTNTGGTIPAQTYANVSAFAGSTRGYSDNNTGSSAQFNRPVGLALNPSTGDIYVADTWNHRIRKITSAGEVSTIAGSGTAGSSNNTTGTSATFNYPTDLAFDPDQNCLYVADKENHVIRKVSLTGTYAVTTFAGSAGSAGYVNNSTATSAKFNEPEGVFFVNNSGTATDYLYVADRSNHMIRVVDINGSTGAAGQVSIFAGTSGTDFWGTPVGVSGSTEGTKVGTAKFSSPVQVAVSSDGNTVYVTDLGNHKVRSINGGTVATLAGSGVAGWADGVTGASAKFNQPYGIEFDGAGHLLVSEMDGDRIRRVTTGGVVTTLAGSTTDNPTGALTNAVGTAARFNQVQGMVLNAAQNILYVCDYENDRVRKIEMGGYAVSPTLPTGLTLTSSTGVISGSPSGSPAPATDYIVTAFNYQGSSATTLNLTIVDFPTLATTPVSLVTTTTASSGGSITSDGGSAVTARGVVWATTTGPTVSLSTKTTDGTGTGSFTSSITGLSSNTTYYLRAYATTAAGTAYGSEVSFTTLQVAPNISYSSSSVTLTLGSPANITLTNTGGTPDVEQVSTLAGATSGYTDGTGAAAKFKGPSGVAVDGIGNVYVADLNNLRIRKITSAGVVSTLAGSGSVTFADGTGTAASFSGPSGVAVDGIGNVYVADNGNHRIRKITSAGVVSTLAGSSTPDFADGTGAAAKFKYPYGVAVDGSGNVYVADQFNNSIRRVTPAGVVSTLAGSFSSPSGVAVDGIGDVFVADYGSHRIRKITSAGVVSTLAGSGSATFADGTGAAAKFNGPSGVAVDGIGNVYVADQFNHRIRKITSVGVVSTLAGSGSSGGFADGTGTAAKFWNPQGVAVDGSGNVYVADFFNTRIRIISRYRIDPALPAGLFFDARTGTITGTPTAAMAARTYTVYAQNSEGAVTAQITLSIASAPTATTGAATNVSGTTATLNATVNANGGSTSALTIKYSTTQSVVDAGNGTIATVSPTSATGNTNTAVSAAINGLTPSTTYYFRVSATNTTGTTNGATLSFTTGPAAPIVSYPGASSPVTLSAGTPMTPLTVTNTGGAIEIMQVTTIAGLGTSGYTDGPATSAQFSRPLAITIDAGGNIYVADGGNHRIRKISTSMVVTTLAGSGTAGRTEGIGTAAQFDFNLPSALLIDAGGDLLVSMGDRVQRITTSGTVTTWAGSSGLPTEGGGVINGTGTGARFDMIHKMAKDASGNVYLTEYLKHIIRKITPTAVVSTLAGLVNISGSSNGVVGASTPTFSSPDGIAVDATGSNIYVSEPQQNRIRKIVISGGTVTVSSFAGGTSGYQDGPLSAAQFQLPTDLAIDGSGNLFVAEANRIRMITPAGQVFTLVGGSFGQADGSGTEAQFIMPKSMVFDQDGNMLLADRENHRIRKITKFSISPALPAGLSFNTATGAISGTPTAITAPQTYTVTTANLGGKATTTFTLSVGASMMTTAASAIGETTATTGGTVGSSYTSITERGVVWHTSSGPTIANNKQAEGTTTTGVFSVNLTGLAPNTTYYVRSYVTYGSSTTDYGNELTFKTNSLGTFSNMSKTFGDAKFSLTAPTAVSTGLFSYGSSDPAVATVTGSEVTITGAGTTTITATQAAAGAFASVNKTMTLTVAKRTPTITLTIPTTTALNLVTGANTITVSGTSSDGQVVTMSIVGGAANGTLTDIGATGGDYTLSNVINTGTITFEGSVSGDGNNNPVTKQAAMDVTKSNQTITFNALSPVTYSSGMTQTLSASTNASGLSVDLTVVSGPGNLTGSTLNITGPGLIVIKASQAGNSTYNAAPDVTRTLTVNPAAPTITGFTPTSATEGDVVTITGTDFQNVTAVSFGGTAATSFNVVSATSITAVLGTGNTGLVSVTTTGGTDTEAGFRYKVTWTGATNAFNTSTNWTGNRPPQTDDDIIFSPTAASDLELDASKTVGHVDFNGSGKSLKLGAYNLTVKGNLTMPGNITGSGKVIMQGSAAQTIRGGGDIPDLEINNSNGVTIDATGGELTVSGTLRSTSGTLTTNGKLRLKSNSGGTARVGVVAGTITGNVIAERYIKRNENSDGTGRAWRLVSVPVTGPGTLRDFFMNGRNGQDLTLTASRDAETDNSGTPIVGHNYATASDATTAGFDWIGVANSVSSLRSYVGDAGGGNFASENVPTMSTTYTSAAQGYMVFARGDRKLDFPSSSSSGATTFRSTGALKTGNQTVTVDPSSTSKYTLVGNPYMSVLDLSALYASNSAVIKPSFWIWDANFAGLNKQGGYVNVFKSGTQWVTNPGSYVNPELLESGMAFFVEPVSSSSSGTLTISESHKSSAASAGLSPFSTDKPDDHGRMYVRLERADNKGRRQIIDGVMADFHTSFKETLTDMSDREKLRNGISRGALWIPREGKILSGEGLPWPKDVKRSIPLSMSGVGDQTLLVHINPTGMRDRYVKAWLKDNVLKREIEINMSQPTDYDFIGTGRSDWDSTRFEIVYVEAGRPGTGVTLEPDDVAETPSVKLYPNPSKTAEVKLSLRAMTPGVYSVQLLDMTGRLVATSTLEHLSVNGEYRVLQGRLLSPGKYLLRLSLEGRLVQTLQLIHE